MPVNQPFPTRTGGFGGADRLAEYIACEKITHVIDATHPFATEISRNAIAACAATDTPLIALARAPWTKMQGDRWIEVPDIAAAVAALPIERARVFLAIGRQHVAAFAARAQHAYTLRFIDSPQRALPLPDCDLIVSRGPFTLAGELDMMRARAVEWVVARNSGGTGARAKIDAARELRLPVVMIARPELPRRRQTESVEEILRWLSHSECLGA